MAEQMGCTWCGAPELHAATSCASLMHEAFTGEQATVATLKRDLEVARAAREAETERADAANADADKACRQRRDAELAHDRKTDEVRELNRHLDAAIQRAVAAEQALAHVCTLHARDDAHEDNGNVVWWTLPICEPPYYVTHTGAGCRRR